MYRFLFARVGCVVLIDRTFLSVRVNYVHILWWGTLNITPCIVQSVKSVKFVKSVNRTRRSSWGIVKNVKV